MIKVGLVVNPYAGSGGRSGHKGSDDLYELNADTPGRMRRFLSLAPREVLYVTASNLMGSYYFSYFPGQFRFVDIGVGKETRTTRYHTMNAVKEFVRNGVEMIVFAGGDGTARDVAEALREVNANVPVLGIPTGVKMHSGVFAQTPEKAAEVLNFFISGKTILRPGEIVDVDEDLYRKGVYVVRRYFVVTTVSSSDVVASKVEVSTEEEELEGIASYFRERLYRPDVTYVFGPGSTVKYVERALFSASGPFLSTDVVKDRKLRIVNASYDDLLGLTGELILVVTPIGGQGFLFGRGNQEIGPEFLRRVGKDRIVVISTRLKLRSFECLRIDTGDPQVDRELSGVYEVLIGYNEFYAVTTCE